MASLSSWSGLLLGWRLAAVVHGLVSGWLTGTAALASCG